MAEQANNNDPMTILKTPIILLVLVLVVGLFIFITQTIPAIKRYNDADASLKAANVQLQENQAQIEQREEAQNQEEAEASSEGPSKGFYRPVESGVDAESLIAAEFNEILSLMTTNKIKTRSVKYTYDPKDDNFVKGAAGRYSVCQLDMQMIASYTNFKNFMKDLYKHDHYLDIVNVEIVPYMKNKTILLIKLQLKLYAEKA